MGSEETNDEEDEEDEDEDENDEDEADEESTLEEAILEPPTLGGAERSDEDNSTLSFNNAWVDNRFGESSSEGVGDVEEDVWNTETEKQGDKWNVSCCANCWAGDDIFWSTVVEEATGVGLIEDEEASDGSGVGGVETVVVNGVEKVVSFSGDSRGSDDVVVIVDDFSGGGIWGKGISEDDSFLWDRPTKAPTGVSVKAERSHLDIIASCLIWEAIFVFGPFSRSTSRSLFRIFSVFYFFFFVYY